MSASDSGLIPVNDSGACPSQAIVRFAASPTPALIGGRRKIIQRKPAQLSTEEPNVLVIDAGAIGASVLNGFCDFNECFSRSRTGASAR